MKKRVLLVPVVMLLVGLLQSPAIAGKAESFAKAVADYKSGNYQLAMSEFGSYVSAYPGDVLCHYYLALCHQALNHRAKAQAEYAYVAQNGNPTLKAHAAQGLRVLQEGRAPVSSSTPAASPAASASTPTSNSPAQQQVAAKGKVKKILKWYADWCGPCKAFAPVYDAAKPKFRDIQFQELDLDDPVNSELKSRYKISSIPRLVMLDDRGNVLYNASPPREQADLEATINQYR